MAIDMAPSNRGPRNDRAGLMTGRPEYTEDLDREDDLDSEEDTYFSDAVVSDPLTTEDVDGPGRGGD